MRKKSRRTFLILSTAIMVLLPLLLAGYIYYIDPAFSLFSVFLVMVMISFGIGLEDKIEEHKMMNVNLVLGIILASTLSLISYKSFSGPGNLISFPLYLWVWLSMYYSGVRVSTKHLDEMDILHALVTSLAGIGTLGWLWLAG